jgi:hypothetical protein
MDQTVAKRFWKRVKTAKRDECWIWQGGRTSQGYGKFSVSGKTALSHRIAWELVNGVAPDKQICHRCDNPSCVNPHHLFTASQKENMRDKKKKGRCATGEGNGNSKLSEEAVRDIRENYIYRKVPLRYFADKYGVAIPTVSSVANFEAWQHIEREN